MSLSRGRYVKPLALGLVFVVLAGVLSIYVASRFVYISPFSEFYASGLVFNKKVGYGTVNGEVVKTYVASVALSNGDPVNGVSAGGGLGYIVSENDWNMIDAGDTVKIRLLPNAKAQVMEIYPAVVPPSWHWESGLKLNLTAQKPQYHLGDTVNFTVTLKNAPTNPGDTPFNATAWVFANPVFFGFQNGHKAFTVGSTSEGQTLSFTPGQDETFSFSLKLQDVSVGACQVRIYLGYLGDNTEATLSATTQIYIFG
jgi:hypothetical protein